MSLCVLTRKLFSASMQPAMAPDAEPRLRVCFLQTTMVGSLLRNRGSDWPRLTCLKLRVAYYWCSTLQKGSQWCRIERWQGLICLCMLAPAFSFEPLIRIVIATCERALCLPFCLAAAFWLFCSNFCRCQVQLTPKHCRAELACQESADHCLGPRCERWLQKLSDQLPLQVAVEEQLGRDPSALAAQRVCPEGDNIWIRVPAPLHQQGHEGPECLNPALSDSCTLRLMCTVPDIHAELQGNEVQCLRCSCIHGG